MYMDNRIILPNRINQLGLNIFHNLKVTGRIVGTEILRDGKVSRYIPGNPNMILTSGQTAFLHNGLLESFGAIRIGTSATAVSPSQTALVALSQSSDSWVYGPSPDGYEYNGTRYDEATGQVFYRKTAEFPEETGTFTYREVGIAASTAGTSVLTRALPTAITGEAGDIVRITYEIGAQLTNCQAIVNNSQFVTGWNTAGTNRLEGYFMDSYSWTDDRAYEAGGWIVPHIGIYDQTIKSGVYGLPLSPIEGRPTLCTTDAMPPHSTQWGYEVPQDQVTYPMQALQDDTVSFGTNSVIYNNSFLPDYQSSTFTVTGLHWRGLYIRFTAPQTKSTSLRLNLTLTRTVT